jgi:hypothetical protein
MRGEQASCGHIDVHLRSLSWASHKLVPAHNKMELAAKSSNGKLHMELRFVRDALQASQNVGSTVLSLAKS